MSIRNEVDALGIKPMRPEFQNIFRNILAYWCNEILAKDYCYIDDVEEMKDIDAGMYDFMSSRGVHSKYGVSIVNRENLLIGFICIEYLTECEVDINNISRTLMNSKAKIETLLDFAINQKKGE